MKNLFCDDKGHVSMGRTLSFLLFFICCGMWIFIKSTKGTVDMNDSNLILWGWGIAIGGKAIQKFGEKK